MGRDTAESEPKGNKIAALQWKKGGNSSAAQIVNLVPYGGAINALKAAFWAALEEDRPQPASVAIRRALLISLSASSAGWCSVAQALICCTPGFTYFFPSFALVPSRFSLSLSLLPTDSVLSTLLRRSLSNLPWF